MSSHYKLPYINPIAISVGPIDVHWYGVMYFIAFLFAFWLAGRQCSKSNCNWNKAQASDLLFFGFLGVILGGRIGYVLFYQFPYFIDNPLYIFKIWQGGMSFHGGTIGVVLAIIYYAKSNNRSILAVGDFVVPLLPFGLGAGRIGNLINSELWGRVTDSPLGIIFYNGGPLPRYPSQIFEFALEGVLLFIILFVFTRKVKPNGSTSGLFLLAYGVFRFIVEFARQPDPQLGFLTFGLTMGQILSIPMVIIGAILIIYAYKNNAIQKIK